jgi:hypothetical protein
MQIDDTEEDVAHSTAANATKLHGIGSRQDSHHDDNDGRHLSSSMLFT